MARIYSKKGDGGYTELADGTPVHKSSARVRAYGSLDELSSFLGLALSGLANPSLVRELEWIQERLFVLGAFLAKPRVGSGPDSTPLDAADVARLEEAIVKMGEGLPPLRQFLLPGGVPSAAQLHCARSVCRRAERAVAALQSEKPPLGKETLPFLNRLSDYLFCAARLVNQEAGQKERLAKS